MRPSARTSILDAAFRLAGHEGGSTPITFEATAREAGVTKGGVLYHFPTREDLVLAVTEYVAERCQDAMQEILDVPLAEATPARRVRAYLRVGVGDRLTRADLAVYVEALANPALGEPWDRVVGRWLLFDDASTPADRARLQAVRFIADGAWMAGALSNTTLLQSERADLLVVADTLLENL